MRGNVVEVIAPDLHSKDEPAWYETPDRLDNVATLIRWLDCKSQTNNWEADQYAYLCEKPWKWQAEWDEMQAEFAAAREADHA